MPPYALINRCEVFVCKRGAILHSGIRSKGIDTGLLPEDLSLHHYTPRHLGHHCVVSDLHHHFRLHHHLPVPAYIPLLDRLEWR